MGKRNRTHRKRGAGQNGRACRMWTLKWQIWGIEMPPRRMWLGESGSSSNIIIIIIIIIGSSSHISKGRGEMPRMMMREIRLGSWHRGQLLRWILSERKGREEETWRAS